jgi:hypothetical protein
LVLMISVDPANANPSIFTSLQKKGQKAPAFKRGMNGPHRLPMS